jgi:hypothetical protein
MPPDQVRGRLIKSGMTHNTPLLAAGWVINVSLIRPVPVSNAKKGPKMTVMKKENILGLSNANCLLHGLEESGIGQSVL